MTYFTTLGTFVQLVFTLISTYNVTQLKTETLNEI